MSLSPMQRTEMMTTRDVSNIIYFDNHRKNNDPREEVLQIE